MKKFARVICMSLAIIMLLPFNMMKVLAENNEKNLTILFTHDMHDHFLPEKVEQNGQVVQLGGYAEMQSAINQERKNNPNSILVDGGDYSMGTLFQTICASDSPELRIMGQMGYDATTFGNHEFDFRADGLADSLNAAKDSSDKLPQILQSNISFPKDKNGQLTQPLTKLKQAMTDYGVKDYTIIERNGIRIGVFGLMGKEAASNAPMAGVKFDDAVENAKRVVDILKKKEKADVVVCLSHSGTNKDSSKSEDEELAKKVPEIDVIISGHSHTELAEPIVVGNTIIGSCGEYGENLGTINISQDSNKRWKLNSYSLKNIDNTLPADASVSRSVDNFKKTVQEKYLDKFNMKFDEVLATSPFNFVPTADIGKQHGEDPLGNLVSDAYVYAVKKTEGEKYEPVTAAIVPSGTIRGSFTKGDITVADAFTASSLGIGADKIPGYPLISVYLTGKELKTVCEVDASIAPLMPEAQLYMSGLNFTLNPNRFIFNRVTDVSQQKADGTSEKLQDDKLYRVVAGLYSAQMLSVVGKQSHGLLSIVPKTKDGKPVTDFEAQIITDSTGGHACEVKEWLAIAEYLKSFDKVNGVPQVPQYYKTTHGRKVVDNRHDLFSIVKNPNGIAIGAFAIVTVVIALIVFVIVRIATRKKWKEKKLTGKA